MSGDLDYDLVIKNGLIVTGKDILSTNVSIGVKNGIIVTITALEIHGKEEIDAQGGYITPGGVDAHVHLDQPNAFSYDTFEQGTLSAISGGTTTVLAFASQPKSNEVKEGENSDLQSIVDKYHTKAFEKSYCDYGFHLILTDVNDEVMLKQLPSVVEKEGITSVKIYTTYPQFKLEDKDVLQVLLGCRNLGMTTMIHAENGDLIEFLTKKLINKGLGDPYYHGVAHDPLAEDEASYRVICLAKLIDTPILIVHMSAKPALESVRRAQAKTLPVYSETCPQYLFLTADRMRSCHLHDIGSETKENGSCHNHGENKEESKPDNFEGAKFVCSPPLRRSQVDLDGVWESIENNTVTIFSSDHAPTMYDSTQGKKAGIINGVPHFPSIPNGLPGLETRMPLLFAHGVETGRISPFRFIEVACTNPAKIYGLDNRKGSIAIGFDADFVIWYPTGKMKPFKLTNEMLHHQFDYTPFEGMEFTNWPRYTILRGKTVWNRDESLERIRVAGVKLSHDDYLKAGIHGTPRSGKYLKRGISTLGGSKRALNPILK